MIKLQSLDKKGLSEIMGYVILIIIAVGLSVLVFGSLSLLVPKDKPECKQDISLSINDYVCTYTPDDINFTLTLSNKGKFSVHAAYVRFGKEGREIRGLINDPENLAASASFFLNPSSVKEGLKPGEFVTKQYNPNILSGSGTSGILDSVGNYVVEIQPAVFDEGDLAICENAVRIQEIRCKSPEVSS